jgi:beta-phosphoglucomutase
MSVPVEAIIFDMDGVLLDSNPVHRSVWELFNRGYGLETTADMHRRMYGKHNDDIVRDFFGNALSDEEVVARGRAKEELYRKMAEPRLEELLVPGVRKFLKQYHNLPKAIATNAEPENVNLLLDGTGLRPFFDVVVDGHQVDRPKPFPDIYLKAAELLGIAPAACVVFEDSHSGVEAAWLAGMRVIGLTTTEVNLPRTTLTVDNFLSRDLQLWLEAQCRPV